MFDLVANWIDAGGPIVIILGALSIYSIALIVLKASQLSGVLSGASRREDAIAAWRDGARDQAMGAVEGGGAPADRVVAAAMAGLNANENIAALEAKLERQGNAELERMSRNLRMLEVIATVSPLIGLLGTVLGMIESFQELEIAKGSANAAVLAGGIWQALLTTAMGLIVAIPAAVAANLMASRVDRAGHLIEDSVSGLLAAHRRGAKN